MSTDTLLSVYLLVVGWCAGWVGRSLLEVWRRHRRRRAWQNEAWQLFDEAHGE